MTRLVRCGLECCSTITTYRWPAPTSCGSTRAAIDALPFALHSSTVEYDNEVDPSWNTYFSQVDPRRER